MRFKSINALGHYVLVQADSDEKTASGIIHTTQEDGKKTNTGTIIGVGDNCELDIKKGDRVIYKKYLPDNFEIVRDKKAVKVEVCQPNHVMANVEDREVDSSEKDGNVKDAEIRPSNK